jgi:CHAT domain-containing protein
LAMGGPSLTGMHLSLPPLPQSAREAKRVESLYGKASSAVFTGDEAREDRWKEEAPRYRVLHLATHGVLNSANPLYS